MEKETFIDSQSKKNSIVSFISNFKKPSIISTNLEVLVQNQKNSIKSTKSFFSDIFDKKTEKSRKSDQSAGAKSRNIKADLNIDFKRPPPIFSIISKYMKESIDEYVYNTKCYSVYDDKEILIFIFDKQLFIINTIDEDSIEPPILNPILLNIKHTQIFHRKIEINNIPDEANCIVIHFYDAELSKKQELNLLFNGVYKKNAYFVYHFINKLNFKQWQIFYESTLLKDKQLQYYNNHFFIKKSNSRGKVQDRILVVTNKFIYNILLSSKKDSIKIEDTKWSDSISSIEKIIFNSVNYLELRIYYNEKINKEQNKLEGLKTLKHKSEREFIFDTNKDRESFFFVIRKNYLLLTRSHFTVEISKEKFESNVSKK